LCWSSRSDCLTIRSSRDRFAVSRVSHSPAAVRLNSGVSAQKKQISAKSFLDKRHKSFSDPLSPALRHISDLIHLRAVSDLLAPGNLSHPRHWANSQLQRANNSFKPTPLRGVVVTSSHPSAPASATLPQRRGLIQALGLMRMHWRQVAGILIGVALTPFALAAAIASAGAGHGNFLLAKLLFPYSMLLTHLTSGAISQPLIALAFVQFPLYGFAASSFSTRRSLLGLFLVHAASATLCFVWVLPIFS